MAEEPPKILPPDANPPSWAATFLPAADRVLYPLTLGITLVVWGFQLYEFFKGGAYRPSYPFAEGYQRQGSGMTE